MRRKRASTNHQQGHQTNIINVHAVVLVLDGVGKSALTVRFLTRRFIWEYDKNLEMTYRHHMTLDGQYVALDIMDTAGENTEEKLVKLASFGELFFILYSITDRISFMEARRLGRYFKKVKNNNSTLILVATKTDQERHRKIRETEGLGLAKELGSVFCEISISEGFTETNSLLFDSLRLCLNKRGVDLDNKVEQENGDKDKSGPLSRMKEGFKGMYARRKSCTVLAV